MSREIYLTKEGRDNLMKELDKLSKRRPVVTEELSRAREHGDLKENAEYHAAKETLANIMGRIAELESKISRTKIIDEKNLDKSKVYIGVTVKLKDDDGDEFEYKIVDEEEADPLKSKISVNSPVAQGLLGHKKKDKVTIQLAEREMKLEILDIL